MLGFWDPILFFHSARISLTVSPLRLSAYQVLVPDAQTYLYDRDIFPLAFVGITVQGDRLAYWLLDSVESVNYELPELRLMSMHVEIAGKRSIPSFNDPMGSISLEMDGKKTIIDEGEESEKILKIVEAKTLMSSKTSLLGFSDDLINWIGIF